MTSPGLILYFLRGKEGLVLKLGEWIDYYIRKNFMEWTCRKTRPFFNYVFGEHLANSIMGKQHHPRNPDRNEIVESNIIKNLTLFLL